MTAVRLALVAFLLCCCTACSRNRVPPGEQDALASLSFGVPFTVHVSLNQSIDGAGNLSGDPGEINLLALFARANLLRATPNMARSPWWQFTAVAPYWSNGTLLVPAARRVVTKRSEQAYWTEGSTQYYAETISYVLEPTAPLARVAKDLHVAGSLRLVLQNDPAVGHWQMDGDPLRGTKWSQDDGRALIRALIDIGGDHTVALHSQIQSARNSAFDLIERSLAGGGVMQRVAGEPGVLFSRANNLHYAVAGNLRLGSITVAQLRATCAQVHQAKLTWRLPHLDELRTLFGRTDFFNQASVVDTPDHRFWPQFAAVAPPGLIVASDTPDANRPMSLLVFRLNAVGAQFVPQFQLTALNLFGADFETAPITDGEGNQYPIFAICVSGGAPGAAQPAPHPMAPVDRPRPPTVSAGPVDPDMDAAANYRRARELAAGGDLPNAVMPLRLAVQYGGDSAVGADARALAMSLGPQLSPRAGVDDGCAIPVVPALFDGASATETEYRQAQARFRAYISASYRFAACIQGVLAGLRTQAAQNGRVLDARVEEKLQGPVDRNDADERAIGAQFETAFAAYRAKHGG
ncbi:MAG TPA: hypothetical protein VGG10_03010 [Rhizomicrobium sp.]